MKKSKVCPKCGGAHIVVNARVGFTQKMYKGQETYVAPLPVAVRTKTMPGLLYGTSVSREEIGTFRSFTCAGCGYTELYAENIEALL
jgi:predicted nucleic-acid-binding Zn-ribbon protein